MHEAKSSLSKLVQQAMDGEEVVIAKAGQSLARLVAYETRVQERTPGLWRGRVEIADDFDTLPADIAAAFEGKAQ